MIIKPTRPLTIYEFDGKYYYPNGSLWEEFTTGAASTLITENVTLTSVEFATLRNGFQLLPTPDVGTWHDVKEINYKYFGETTPYFGFDANNLFAIFGGGLGVKNQIYTKRGVFLQIEDNIWKQFPQTREDSATLSFDPAGVLLVPSNLPLTAYFTRENLTGGDGYLEMEIIYEVKTI